MELDELKKQWSKADNLLEQKPLASEEGIGKLIATGRNDMRQKLQRLSSIQRISLSVGTLLFLFFAIIGGCVPDIWADRISPQRCIFMLAFIVVSLIGGWIWDWKTFRWIRAIRTDEMSVVEVSRRMAIFQCQMRNEIIAICVWVVIFNALNFWVMGYHLAPLPTQVLVIVLLLGLDVLIIFILYKKVLYKYIKDIRKNIEELKDICLE